MSSDCGRVPVTPSTRLVGASLVEVLHHFEHIASCTIGTLSVQHTMRTTILSLAYYSPFFMNAIFAFSAKHSHTLKPEDQGSKFTAEYHGRIALQLYVDALAGELKVSEVDSTFAPCLLVTAMAFFTEKSSPSASYIFSDDPEQAEWLTIVASSALLLRRRDAEDVISKSIWKPMVTRKGHHVFPQCDPGQTGLPEAFVELCHIGDDSIADENPY